MRPASWLFVIVLVAGLYAWDRWSGDNQTEKRTTPAAKSEPGKARETKPAEKPETKANPSSAEIADGNWRKLGNPRLVENGGNDGDSFFLAHGGGQERYRLYFVDTPETSRRYPDRLGHQARYFGGINFDRLISGGKEAKEFSLDLLRRHELEVWTKNERVMDSDRLHALVRFPDRPGQPWLHEDLVKAGLARIYTMPTDLPDGTPKEQHLRQLKDLETGARREKRGLWGE
jgi:endonuclease YncB( thermonuclease family)